MGVKDGHPLFETNHFHTNIKYFKNCTALIDAMSWAIKSSYTTPGAKEETVAINGFHTSIDKRLNLLISYQIKPIMVVDGRNVPIKWNEQKRRRDKRTRTNNNKKVEEEEEDDDPKHNFLMNHPQGKSKMVSAIVGLCASKGVDCIVSPLEADPQIAWMYANGYGDIIISEDSDFILYGCSNVFFKMNNDGNGDFWRKEDISRVFGVKKEEVKDKTIQLLGILMGTDFSRRIPNIGPARGVDIVNVSSIMDVTDILAKKDALYPTIPTPDGWIDQFNAAEIAFQHGLIFNLRTREVEHLNPPLQDLSPKHLANIGFDLLKNQNHLEFSMGNIDPNTGAITGSWDFSNRGPQSIWNMNYKKKPWSLPAVIPVVDHAAPVPKMDLNCPCCGQKNASPAILVFHLRVHTGERPFQCPHCPYSSKRPNHLTNHHNVAHNPAHKFQCTLCSCKFATQEGLNIHLGSEHPDFCTVQIQNGACSLCGTKTNDRTQHFNACHHPKNLYSCVKCCCRYKTAQGLGYHMVASHSWNKKKSSTRASTANQPSIGNFLIKQSKPSPSTTTTTTTTTSSSSSSTSSSTVTSGALKRKDDANNPHRKKKKK